MGASSDSCLRGPHCRNLWVPREQPSTITTKTPAALLLHLTHRNTRVYGGGSAPATMNTPVHTNTGAPLHIPSLTMETPRQHRIVMDIRGLVCVCMSRTVGGDGRRQGCRRGHAEDLGLFAPTHHVPTSARGAKASRTGAAEF